MDGINEKIADLLISNAIDIQRLGEGRVQAALEILLLLQEDLRRQIRGVDLKEVSFSRLRTKQLLKQIENSINLYVDKARDDFFSHLLDIGQYSAEAYARSANQTFNTDIVSTLLTTKRLEAIIKTTPLQGGPSSKWWEKQAADTALKFNSQLQVGLTAGETIDQLVERVIGKKAGYHIIRMGDKKYTIPVYAQGVLDMTRKDVTSLVRTHVQTVANEAIQSVVRENSDLIRGQRALVTLDGRTSDICRARSGAAWDLDGNPLPESTVKYSFPGPPPWHWNCRTILVPVFKSWAHLASESGASEEIIKKLRNAPEFGETQSSMDGQVPRELTYEQWFKTKPENFQREVLGAGRFQLWKEGKISFGEMVTQSGRPLTVTELRSKFK